MSGADFASRTRRSFPNTQLHHMLLIIQGVTAWGRISNPGFG
ncbi:hypothetical protein AtDm6_1524 [Acetobacter tropicalis]|uniref:Uncharacterized protein n=1 Tax=Acetobacter tropicalis TaxID=104102 RepID=A0A094YR79_9PROT|nr:hypothetical protein AtDm6_1524 [Acetobacter tropicalis]